MGMKEKDFKKMIKKMQKYMADDVEVFSPFFNITGKDKVMSTMKLLMTYMKENNLQMDGLESKFIPLKDGFITLSEYQVKMDNTNTDDTDTTNNNNIDIDTEAKKDKVHSNEREDEDDDEMCKDVRKIEGGEDKRCTCNMNEGEGGEEGGEEQQGDSVTIKRADVVLVDEDDKIKQSFSFLDLPKGPQSAGLLREFEKIKSYLKENQGDDADEETGETEGNEEEGNEEEGTGEEGNEDNEDNEENEENEEKKDRRLTEETEEDDEDDDDDDDDNDDDNDDDDEKDDDDDEHDDEA